MKKRNLFLIFLIILLLFPYTIEAAEQKKQGSNDNKTQICNKGVAENNYLHSAIEIKKHKDNVDLWETHQIKVYNFETSESDTAYCIHPGKKAAGVGKCKDYWLIEEFLSDGCTSTADSLDCGLAGMLSYAYTEAEGQYDYIELLTALRLWNALRSDEKGDGWWTDGDLTSKKTIYFNTATHVNSDRSYTGHGFWEYTVNVEKGVLFEHETYGAIDNYNQVDDAFGLYRLAIDGIDLYSAFVKVVEDDYEFDEKGYVTVQIETSFGDKAEIINIESSAPATVANFSESSCGSGRCFDVQLYVDPEELKTCDTLDLELTITYKDPDDILGNVKKYETNNPDYQTFIVYSEGDEIVKSVDVEIACQPCDPKTECCTGDTYETNSNCGKCADLSIKYEVPESCGGSGGDDVEGIIEDPPLCTLTSNQDKKNKYKLKEITYDSASKSGNVLCNVFCKEKFLFKFMGKKEAIAGRTFKYSVTGKQLTEANKYLTTVVATRECASTDINYDKWKQDYIDLNAKLLTAWNNFKFWEARYLIESPSGKKTASGKSCSACGGGTCIEVCGTDPKTGANIYCSHTDKTIPAISLPTWYWYDWAGAKYRHTNSDGSLDSSKDASGTSGSANEKRSCSRCDASMTCSDDAGTSALGTMNTYKSEYDGLVIKQKAMIDAVNDCSYELKEGVIKDIVDYKYASKVDYEYEDYYSEKDMIDIKADNLNNTSQPKKQYCSGDGCSYESICPTCETDLSQTVTGSLEKETLIKWECKGEKTDAICEDKKVDVPKSKASYVSTETEEAYYQANDFYTQLYSGTVTIGPSENSIIMEDRSGQTNYLYPLELNKSDGLYGTLLEYKDINKEFRKKLGVAKIKDIAYECSIDVINETTLCEGACAKEEIEKVSLGYIFRPIDMGQVFPNPRIKGRNWQTAESVIEAIQKLNENFWINVKPQYSVTITPVQIRQIKKYNQNTSYLDFSSVDCRSASGEIDPTSCKSRFLNDYLTNNNNAEKFYKNPDLKLLQDANYNYYTWRKKANE